MSCMDRLELSEPCKDEWQVVRDEIRQSNERVDAMLLEFADSCRRHVAEIDSRTAALESTREEPKAFRRELWKRIGRLPPPAQAA
jgi:hypothetical protein